ncbi:lysyl oxidase family protein [Streptomyces jumonjinensis]|uniref:Protein-lysine 6-oxidase n=1 Tax=Streptomyces jumonjinensis TaxID=1945 RepID=A0A646KII4_STRJU|nr:lysyl oxidase family protein [Streptomyces jumonjinensis]MQT00866.1 protein-lysine 6-oxidase [Streptomyces jumonjinensis]
MTRSPRTRLWRSTLAVSAAIAVTAGVVAAAPDSKKKAPAAAKPKLSLIAATKSVTLDKYSWSEGVWLDLGTYVTAEGAPFEFKVTRESYKKPIVAKQIIRDGKKTTTKTLPTGTVKDFSGLPDFVDVKITDPAGKTVLKTSQNFCPNNASGRVRPDAPATSKYPGGCPTNPFTLGSVWGVEEGWASNTYSGHYEDDATVDLAAGSYTAKISVAKKYRDLFGIANKTQTVKVTVIEHPDEPGEGGWGAARKAAAGAGADAHAHHAGHGKAQPPVSLAEATGGTAPTYNVGHGPHPPAPPALPWALKKNARTSANIGDKAGQTDGSRQAPGAKPNAKRPTGKPVVPASAPKPDLRSLPAYGVTIVDGKEYDTPGKDYVAFSANVWNAGPAQLVVDGFRKPGADLMDAYQYFYDAKGKQIGYTPTGTMEWDPRPGHVHWHFTDFASYRLLKEDKKEAVRSGKEAFCLANTDAVDYTVKNANWHPDGTDLSTSCGQENSISVREVLDVGSGDTYTQDLPDQSFDITDVPNGTYWIQVLANPEKRLKETSTSNNSALRKIVLGGKPGARTVSVPAHHLVDAN